MVCTFLYFYTIFFLGNYLGHGEFFYFFQFDFLIFHSKKLLTCTYYLLCVNKWVASESYRLCMQCHPVAWHDILPCFLKRHCVLFFLVWFVTAYSCWIIADDCFFFFSSSLPDKVYDCPLYFYFFNFSPCYFDLLFGLYSFYKSLFVFNLVIYNFSYVFFSFWFLFFWFLIYFIWHFV